MYPLRVRQAYRCGDRFSFDPDDTGEWQPITLVLKEGSRIEWSGTGVRLVYHGDIPFGVNIRAAIQLGWCSLKDGSGLE